MILVNKVLERWYVGPAEELLAQHIRLNHKLDDMPLVHFNRLLEGIYNALEIPEIVRKHSPKLGMSIIEFLARNENGASILLKEFNKTWEEMNK